MADPDHQLSSKPQYLMALSKPDYIRLYIRVKGKQVKYYTFFEQEFVIVNLECKTTTKKKGNQPKSDVSKEQTWSGHIVFLLNNDDGKETYAAYLKPLPIDSRPIPLNQLRHPISKRSEITAVSSLIKPTTRFSGNLTLQALTNTGTTGRNQFK